MSNWRLGYAATEKIQRVRPESTDEELNNPHRGWVTFQRFLGDPLQFDNSWHDDLGPVTFPKGVKTKHYKGDLPSTVTYCRWPWGVLEPEKGKFRFDIIEKTLQTAKKRGQTVQMRTQPFVHSDLPKWFLRSGVKYQVQGATGNFQSSQVIEPDSNDPKYIKNWSEHISQFGKHFDGDPRLESFDVSYAGRFGECGGNATPKTAAKLVDAYRSAFKKTTLLSMISTEGCRYASTLKSRQFGWRGDGFIDIKNKGKGCVPDGLNWNHMWDVFPFDIYEYGVAETWKTAPMTMEPYATIHHCFKNGWEIDWLLEHCLKYHPTIFMNKSTVIPPRWHSKVAVFAKKLGYRFYLHLMTLPLSVKGGEKINISVAIDNKGVAPIYRPYKFALKFSQGKKEEIVEFKEDIRRWLPDYSTFRENIVFPQGFNHGEVKVACGIVNDRSEPVVKLAIKKVDIKGWHALTSMDVE